MRLRLTRPAARQLDRLLAYIAQHNPDGARKVQQRLQDVMQMLLHYPYAGPAIARPGVRRIVVSPYPYAITYRIGAEEIVIRSIRHTARRTLS